MKTLILMRHAKSDWSGSELADHDRPLNARGQEAAERLAAFLKEQAIKPSRILCSTARRARDTLAPILAAYDAPPVVDYDERLYMATAPRLLKIVQGLSNADDMVLVIGHNPGLHALALALAMGPTDGDRQAHQDLANKFPTGAMAILRFSTDSWRKVDPHCGALADFIRPKAFA